MEIHKGKVNLYFPYTESLYMNIDEYFIYLMRLRRYGEIEMLNDVLLMNKNIFMREVEEPFDFDNFIVKLYNTFIMKMNLMMMYIKLLLIKK